MDESISGQKAVIVQGIQDDVVAGFVEQNERVRKATFKGRMFSGILFPVMNGMSFGQHSYCYFVGSAVLLNDKNIETATALGLIVMFTQFSQQYYQPLSNWRRAGEVCNWPLQVQTVSKKCLMQKKKFVLKMLQSLTN